MTRRRWLFVVAATLALVLIAGRALAASYADWAWYQAMGALPIWRVRAANTLLLCAGSAGVGALVLSLNLYAVRRSVVSLVLPRRISNIEIGEEVSGRALTRAAVALSLIVGMLLALPANRWTTLALARFGLPFGETDPFFQIDLGSFVYWIPLERMLCAWALVILLVTVALVVLLYALTPSLRWTEGHIHASTHVRRHLALLGALVLTLLAWQYRLDAFAMLITGTGPEGLVTAADRSGAVQLSPLLVALCLIAALLVVGLGWKGRMRALAAMLTGVVVFSLGLRQAYPWLFRQVTPATTLSADETVQGELRASYSRRAFASDEVVADATPTPFASGNDAVPWVSMWDPIELTLALTGPSDSLPAGDVAWWTDTHGLIAAVATPPDGLADNPAAPWSLTRVRATDANATGDVVRLIDEGPGHLDRRAMVATFVYPGAKAYLIVSDSTRGVAGAILAGALARIAHAWNEQDVRLLLEQPRPSARLLSHRDVRDRVRHLVPFLAQGNVVVPAYAGDTLLWTLDLYASSTSYPLSSPIRIAGERQSYFHHAATALVNGTTGRVTLVRDVVLERIAESWVRAFPQMFVEWHDVRPDVLPLLPPSVDGALAQAVTFARFGSATARPPKPWDGASGIPDGATASALAPLALPGTPPTIAMVQPTLNAAGRIDGVIVAHGGLPRRTEWWPLLGTAQDWRALKERLAVGVDSMGTTSDVPTGGPVRAVPIGAGLSLIQSWYRMPTGAGGPTVHHVAVLAGDSVRSTQSLADALGSSGARGRTLRPAELQARLTALYDRMRLSLQRGDWLAFGAAFDTVGVLLGRPPR